MPSWDSLQPIEPFLRWAGGKRKLVASLVEYVPNDFRKRHYHEPFLGAGSLFLSLQPSRATLSDANPHLIQCYRQVSSETAEVSYHLSRFAASNSEQFYYRIRDEYNNSEDSPQQAARFIYLNKTCFNGIFRVNTKGQFNVPYGHKEPPSIPSFETLNAASRLLRHARISNSSFEKSLAKVRGDHFVYLDPPYPPLNGTTAYFTHYTKDRFGENDQILLSEHVKHMSSIGAKVLMTNADLPIIRKLYHDFHIRILPVTRYVSCKSKKIKVNELAITNYDTGDRQSCDSCRVMIRSTKRVSHVRRNQATR